MPPVARLRRAIFARHCNPWSAWTRWASTPLTLVPLWTLRWSHAVLIGLFGEELWIARRPRDAAMSVSALISAVSLGAVIAARRHQLVPAAITTAVQMALTLVYWEQMARYFDRQLQAGGTRPQ